MFCLHQTRYLRHGAAGRKDNVLLLKHPFFMKRKNFQNLFQIDDSFRSIATTMAGNIITAAFVGCSIIFTSVTLLSHTWGAVISHLTADDLSAIQTQVDDEGQ